jgi:hypothetical protein
MRPIAAAALLLAAFSVRAGEAAVTYLEMKPDSTTEVENGLVRLHFAYPGGCYDVTVPSEWKLMKTKEDFTKYGDAATKCTTVFTRWDAAPGKPLNELVADYVKAKAERDKARQARLSEKYKADLTDERVEFDEENLFLLDLGKEPNLRPGALYLSDASTATEKVKKKVFWTVTQTQTRVDVKTRSKLKVTQMGHAIYSALDGPTRIQIQFNCNTAAWLDFEPKADAVIDSLAFGACAK